MQVVGSSLGSLDLAGSEQTIYETPYSLLDNISPAYRSQPFYGTLHKENPIRFFVLEERSHEMDLVLMTCIIPLI
jgi:hypothetical protein